MSLIELRNVSKVYNAGLTVRALDDVSVVIDEGEFVAIMGASGSGKSTLLTVLGCMNAATGGQVIVDDIDIYGLSVDRQADYRRAYLGFVFQEHHLLPHLTALENVLLALTICDGRDSKVEDALEALRRVGLSDKADRLPGQLSGGEQARVAIARSLVRRPPIILADEPTGNLDSRTGEEILRLLQELNAQGQTIILVTHNEQAAHMAKRIIRLADGKVISDERNGSGSPRNSVTQLGDTVALAAAHQAFSGEAKPRRSLMQMFFVSALVIQALIFLLLIWLTLAGDLAH